MSSRPVTSIVTGAAGFIGFALASRLAADPSQRVILIDNFIRGERDEPFLALCARPNVEFCELDLAASDAVSRLPAGPVDYVFHLAALNGTQNFYERPYEVLRCSTLPTFAVIERYVRTREVRERFVYAGSSEAYASTVTRFEWKVPTDESVPPSIDEPLNPRWSYGASKLHGEVLTSAACREFGAAFTVIRYHNVYGPRMGDKHVIPDFIERMARGEFALYGHEDTRSFLYIDDAVEATLRVARSPAAANEIVNVGSDQELSIRDLGQAILEVVGATERIDLHPSPAGSVRRRAPELSKLRRICDFAPVWSLERGLTETLRWYLARATGPRAAELRAALAKPPRAASTG
jgi:UDP-glucose 4-epimerase